MNYKIVQDRQHQSSSYRHDIPDSWHKGDNIFLNHPMLANLARFARMSPYPDLQVSNQRPYCN